MNKLKQTQKIYKNITPPQSYNLMVERAVSAVEQKRKKTDHYKWVRPALVSTAAMFAICVIMLNTMPTFASAVYEIPIIGEVARVFTFRTYELSDTTYDIQVEMPSIRNTGNTDLEVRINDQIQDKIDSIVENAKIRGKAVLDDQLASGGTEEELVPFYIMISYEVKFSNENMLSFVINDMESSVTAYNYQTFYNIDLNTGKDITLADKLGDQYIEIISERIQEQIEQRILEHPDWSYTLTSATISEALSDTEKPLKFYINEAENIVISFDKGEIAPPPMGIQDFEIIK
ncbi:DUF3298 and DUF4163 domain-containing protein [Fusibacter sp. 3D3]|uniref:DUF3298 and DUF4163 domain-containing protein n=1 Tax=Fusibacter sp. 3D3 TaxID=1048380 RepID=UPI000853CCBC|nr:DUF3298 and DUF4163 domain-containing protein [Fusibacter sp. 3D3]GAU76015.1 anti-sigma factor homolog yrhM [Fusibacter sp. 3D3]